MACRCPFSKRLPVAQGAQGCPALSQHRMMCWGQAGGAGNHRKLGTEAHVPTPGTPSHCLSPWTSSGSHSLQSSRCTAAAGPGREPPERGLHLLSSGLEGPSRRSRRRPGPEQEGGGQVWGAWGGQKEKAPGKVGSGQVPQGGCAPGSPRSGTQQGPASLGL